MRFSAGRIVRDTAPKNIIHGTAEPNFATFFTKWEGLPVEWVAQSVGAVDQRPIGYVARRVAADAIVFINNKGKGLNAVEQISVINECLGRTVAAHLRGESNPTELILSVS